MHQCKKADDQRSAERDDFYEHLQAVDFLPAHDRNGAISNVDQVISDKQNLIDFNAQIGVIRNQLRHENIAIAVTDSPDHDDDERRKQQVSSITGYIEIHNI